MVATALAIDAADTGGAIAQWRQLVDLVVQARGGLAPDMRDAVLARIAALTPSVPPAQRRSAAEQLAARIDSFDAVTVFARDEPAVAAPALMTARLSDAEWRDLIPTIPATSRLLLRQRRDLPDGVRIALGAYGHSDFQLPAVDPDIVAGTQIRDLVARIEAFRSSQSVTPPLPAAPPDHFTFETAADGTIDWIAGVAREALIGMSIAEPAEAGGHGVDGHAAGAFRRRAPFGDARMSVAGTGPAGGIWLIGASPVFNPRDGRFAGYHGSARRPRADEVASPMVLPGTAMPVDSLRQLIHELRTPLNAILGFAEMIDRQLLGPAAHPYRTRANAVIRDGRRLLELVDDLDHAARPALGVEAGARLAVRPVIDRVVAALAPLCASRACALVVDGGGDIAIAGLSAAAFERMMHRLLGALVGVAGAGEAVSVTIGEGAAGASIGISRPALSGKTGPEAGESEPDAPLLGLDFTLRMVANIARAAGGRLAIAPDSIRLSLPGARSDASGLPAGAPCE